MGDIRFVVDLRLLLDEAEVGVEAQARHLGVDIGAFIEKREG